MHKPARKNIVKSQSGRRGSKQLEIEQTLITSKKGVILSKSLNISEYTSATTYEQKRCYLPSNL